MTRPGRATLLKIGGTLLLSAVSLLTLGAKPTRAEPPVKAVDRSAKVASARERAEAMHSVYAATLVAMHDHYFHGERAIVPARALEDVFADIAREQKIEARWISVNAKPMSIKHEPKSDFELQAAAALAKGDKEFERVDKDYFERAGVIRLTDECIACHSGFFSAPPKTPRVAGLIIRVPLDRE